MTDAVWPDGAREAVQATVWEVVKWLHPLNAGEAILTALEPFVQQRIEAALSDIAEMVPPAIGIYQTIPDRVRLVIAQRDEAELIVADLRAEAVHANALAESRRIAEEGAREMRDHEHVERSQAESLLADADADRHRLRADVARLREDGERLNREVQVLRKVRTALIEDMRTVFDSPTADATESLQRRTRDLIDYADSWLSANLDAARSAPGGEG